MVLTSSSRKFKRKQRYLWWRRIFFLGLKGIFIASVVLLVWSLYKFILTSPNFYINRVVVSGLQHVDRDDFEEFINIPPNTNIFTISIEALRKKAESHPWIKRASVSRKLPDTIEMRVQ